MGNILIVNTDDEVVGSKQYKDVRYEDIYRVTALWLTDLHGKYCLITQRKWTKQNDPGKWIMAVSGTVEEGETYDSNIAKETLEEIGVSNIEFMIEKKIFIDDGNHKFFVQFFSSKIDKEKTKIEIQTDEVEAYRWLLIEDLLNWINLKPDEFVPSMMESLASVKVVKQLKISGKVS